jgi:hypothetical protein
MKVAWISAPDAPDAPEPPFEPVPEPPVPPAITAVTWVKLLLGVVTFCQPPFGFTGTLVSSPTAGGWM